MKAKTTLSFIARLLVVKIAKSQGEIFNLDQSSKKITKISDCKLFLFT